MSAEEIRLEEARAGKQCWKKWGPYLSERQWGTVREDYSQSGDAWNYFTHDQARSRAYRWGEDGLAGFSDDRQLLCFALCLWNGRDPILKERLFGLANEEGNHGEDVKEYYFYLDATPTHSYLKCLYKYPQRAYPYKDLVTTNRGRSRSECEYELIDTGVFDDNRYFDVFVEYAKASAEDILIQISAYNRGPEAATLHLLPSVWFRNTWSWGDAGLRPALRLATPARIAVSHSDLGDYSLAAEAADAFLFTNNDTNAERLYGVANQAPYVKDAFHQFLIQGDRGAINPQQFGTKAAAYYRRSIASGSSVRIRLRLSSADGVASPFGAGFDKTLAARRNESDEFYSDVIPASLDADAANIMRQALAGMLWSKQYYYYDVDQWLNERSVDPFRSDARASRNAHWHHMYNADIISMPDKWEYPWYATWDLAFHCLALTLVDPDFGKHQLDLMLKSPYMHPNGQLPAYEWNFGDVNPPVHAWATMFTYRLEKVQRGKGDIEWLERSFQKLLLNFTWWVNRKDRVGSNVFEGGFLGLDNIGVFDRSAPLPTGGYLDQADGTAWMALFCQCMLEIAIELTLSRPSYMALVEKFTEHALWITSSMLRAGEGTGMWDEEDGFFYDVLRLPDGRAQRLKVRSMVGLIPLCAVTVYDAELRKDPEVEARLRRFVAARPELFGSTQDFNRPGKHNRLISSVLDESRLRRVLARMLDEREFLSPYGVRALSRIHADHPYVLRVDGIDHRVSYLAAESDNGMFGGNSNWRGPVWMPVNALIIGALLQYYMYYGDDFTIECPTGSGRMCTLYQVAEQIGQRLERIFRQGEDGRRPVYGGTRLFQEDPYWRDCILFYEYFHGDNGAGLGASHQTGWTGLIARIMHLFATSTGEEMLQLGKAAFINEVEKFAAGGMKGGGKRNAPVNPRPAVATSL
jgi:hypothetical protein